MTNHPSMQVTRRQSVHSLWAVLLGLLLYSNVPLHAAELDAETQAIIPPQVYQEALRLRDEVEQVRQVLGKRLPRERSFTLSDALPRQTFYQAQTLFRKCNQLAQEVAGVSRERPQPAPDRDIVPGDVLRMLNAARGQLAHVREELGITDEVPLARIERRRTPSDVMRQIIDTGYVLNRLIDAGAEWPDIYDRVMQMITYTGGVLPEGSQFPELPEHACCKMPEDVYQSLARIMEDYRPIAESVDFALVRITPRKRAEGGASTDTVFDLTTTMVSDIGEITLRLHGDGEFLDAIPEYERPARTLPSHVYRLTTVLSRRVETLRGITSTPPAS